MVGLPSIETEHAKHSYKVSKGGWKKLTNVHVRCNRVHENEGKEDICECHEKDASVNVYFGR